MERERRGRYGEMGLKKKREEKAKGEAMRVGMDMTREGIDMGRDKEWNLIERERERRNRKSGGI